LVLVFVFAFFFGAAGSAELDHSVRERLTLPERLPALLRMLHQPKMLDDEKWSAI
jgi:hypothetical protein